MRVAIFTNAYKPIVSGVVVHIASIRDALIARGHQVYVFAPEFYDYKDDEEGVYRYKSVDLTRKVDFPVALPYSSEAFEVLKEFRPDIIHVHHPFVLGQTAYRYAKRLDVPIVFTFHTDYELYSDFFPFPHTLVRSVGNKIVKDFGNKVSCIVTPSRAKAQLLREHEVTNRIEIIYNAIDLNRYAHTDTQVIDTLRERLGLEGKKVLLYVGRVASEKNIGFLLQAFEKVNDARSDTALVIVGDGPEMEDVRGQASRSGKGDSVVFTGNVEYERLPEFYAMADIFAFTSENENLPMVVLEAMASGLPIATLNVDWARDIMTDGTDGVLAEESVEEYSRRVLELLNDDGEYQRIRQGEAQTVHKYSLKEVSKKLFALYEELIDEGSDNGSAG